MLGIRRREFADSVVAVPRLQRSAGDFHAHR
jgi:hypothetical protein